MSGLLVCGLLGVMSCSRADEGVASRGRDAIISVTSTIYGEGEGYILGTVGDGAFDSRRRVYILDTQERSVFVFDSTGMFLARRGAAGTGPGEFSSAVSAIGIGGSDELLVIDRRRGRLIKFSDEGSVVEIPLPDVPGRHLRWSVEDGSGAVLIEVIEGGEVRILRWDPDNGREPKMVWSRVWEGFAGTPGLPVEEVATLELLTDWKDGEGVILTSTGDSLHQADALTPVLAHAHALDGVAASVTSTDRKWLYEAWRDAQVERGVPEAVLSQIEIRFPDVLPRFTDVHLDTQGVWITSLSFREEHPMPWLVRGLRVAESKEFLLVNRNGTGPVNVRAEHPGRLLDVRSGRTLLLRRDGYDRPIVELGRLVVQ